MHVEYTFSTNGGKQSRDKTMTCQAEANLGGGGVGGGVLSTSVHVHNQGKTDWFRP